MASFSETGSYSGHLRLRAVVDVGDPGPNTSSVNVRLRVWVGTDGWNINDGQRVGFSGWKSGSVDFNNNLSSGEKLVVDRSWSHSVGNSSVSRYFSATLSGNNATGSSPSVRVNFSVAGRPGSPPGKCRYLKVSNIKSTGAKFDWDPPLDNGGLPITSYHLHYRREEDSEYNVVMGIDTSTRTIGSSFNRNTVYRWRVRAVNSAGFGDLNDGGTFRTDSERPIVGLPVEVQDLTATSCKIVWGINDNGGSSTDKSHVIVSTSTDMFNLPARVHEEESGVILSRVVTGLTRATKYYYWIRIWNGTYWSNWTQIRDFTTLTTEPKNRPQLQVSASGPTVAQMSWAYTGDTGGSAVTGYDWQVSEADDFSSLLDSGSTTGTSREQTGLVPASQYYFRVRAKNAVGTGPWSTIKSLIAPQGVKIWNGTAWVAKPTYYWNGTDWAVPSSIKGRAASGWREAS